MDSKGVKNVLMQRLQEAYENESLNNSAENNGLFVADPSTTPIKAIVIKEEILEAMDVKFLIFKIITNF